ncbi:AlpA family transcriptional regulator [Gayadomonas joobiniege]|uniref:AlpA family transcriptional regulator n=1 Tax=Gayadomonas joobiniege TaxID=1234606 RepID=UPI00036D1378|nr:AlpA family transcriptional regulator [Gayadomonas joobiniege]
MRFIKLKEVIEITTLSRSSIYQFMKEEKFPKAVSLGGRSVAWVEDEVTDWMMDKVENREGY